MMSSIRALFRSSSFVPQEYKSNFLHLYFDTGWYGILNGSILTFIAVYAAHLGANSLQIGLITSVPAIINLAFTIPAGAWLEKQHLGGAVFKSSVITRIFYLLFIPLPWLFAPDVEIWILILITLVMSIPGVALAIGFNAFFAEAVPLKYRGHVAGIRNAVFAVTTTLTTLLCGWMLEEIRFPLNYQILFGIGLFGSLFSSVHLRFIKSIEPSKPELIAARSVEEERRITRIRMRGDVRARIKKLIQSFHFDLLSGRFFRVMFLIFLFHLFQYLPAPIFPIQMVNVLNFSDQWISVGMAVFYLAMFLGSTQLSQITSKIGNQAALGLGAGLMGAYPLLLLASKEALYFIAGSFIGGLAWSLAGGTIINYLLERVPAEDRPAHFAWYNIFLNSAILIGSTLGGPISDQIGLPQSLLLFGVGRILAGLLIIWKG
ncbi:MAG: MFS transporter [Chloroflexi bacterium]|nr:MFS transporter [Chloroflexota bacterium]